MGALWAEAHANSAVVNSAACQLHANSALSMSTQQTHAMYGGLDGESSADLTRVVIVDFEF